MEPAHWHMWWKQSGARELRKILMEEWDPIGVAGTPEAADEYDSYLGQIAERLCKGESGTEIGDYLTWVEEEWMGFGRTGRARARNRQLGARLVAWYLAATKPE